MKKINTNIKIITANIILIIIIIALILYQNHRQNLFELQDNLSELKELLINYESSDPVPILEAIQSLCLEKNEGELIHIYGNNYVTVRTCLDSILKGCQRYKNEMDYNKSKMDTAQRAKEYIDKWKSYIDEMGIEDISISGWRRFDTDYLTGKGVYKATSDDASWGYFIVLIAWTKELHQMGEAGLTVTYRGEEPYTLRHTNGYTTWYETIYWDTYETVNCSGGTRAKIEQKYKKAMNLYNKLKATFDKKTEEDRKKLDNSIKTIVERVVKYL